MLCQQALYVVFKSQFGVTAQTHVIKVLVDCSGSRGSFSVKPLKVPDAAFLEPGSSGSPRIDAWSPRTAARGGFGPASPHR